MRRRPGYGQMGAQGLCRVRFFWYNNRKAVIIHLMAGAIRGRGPLPP
ncbi:hypothetical protein ANACOL_00994 [Anaerotruncus colihominis DSM 17241]|uniref:Uncharacterized protein n=1 Tax=Anaerotruncus colihominis DSM 17241 TaxID=445972 RepID=B0P8A5_9FIRM|nr:hypothetical protein ANACOL_00994 [Anaerotruncus colihominis DSM 17241]